MTSTIRGTQGGGFGRSDRFQRGASGVTPAAIYEPKSFVNSKMQAPVYKPMNADPGPQDIKTMNSTLPSAYHGRQSFMIGKARNDLCYHDQLAEKNGPKFYPNMGEVQRRNERAVMGKADRFQSLTTQYVSKEHNSANLCTASMGPKYKPRQGNIDLTTDQRPSYSFRSKGENPANRTSFLGAKIMNGYVYQAVPATLNMAGGGVSSCQYSPVKEVVLCRAPKNSFGKDERFGVATKKRFLSRKHSNAMKGLETPGAYAFTNGNIGGGSKYNASTKWK